MDPSTPPAREALALLAGLTFAGAGVWAWLCARRAEERFVRLAGVGRLSPATLHAIALACLALGYHIIAHAFEWRTLRAPLRVVAVVGGGAILVSLALDALERRRDDRDPLERSRDGSGHDVFAHDDAAHDER